MVPSLTVPPAPTSRLSSEASSSRPVGGVRVEPGHDRHGFAVPARLDADREPLLAAREVLVDAQFVGKPGDFAECVLCHNHPTARRYLTGLRE